MSRASRVRRDRSLRELLIADWRRAAAARAAAAPIFLCSSTPAPWMAATSQEAA